MDSKEMFSDTEPFPKVKSQTDVDAGSFNGFLQLLLLLTILNETIKLAYNERFVFCKTHSGLRNYFAVLGRCITVGRSAGLASSDRNVCWC